MAEELAGGNSNVVVRAGDTVRRVPGPWTPAVHRLLTHLRACGVGEVPEPLGFDAEGREILTFLPGVAGAYPLPAWLWGPAIVTDAGALLRRVHDASTALVTEDLTWGSTRREPAEVICHNDVAPYNMAFAGGRLVGLFDFDAASPGPRIWDLAYLAYRLAPFGEDAGADAPTGAERLTRLDRLLDAYGSEVPRDAVLATMVTRLRELADDSDRRADVSGRAVLHEHAAMYRRDALAIARLPSSGSWRRVDTVGG